MNTINNNTLKVSDVHHNPTAPKKSPEQKSLIDRITALIMDIFESLFGSKKDAVKVDRMSGVPIKDQGEGKLQKFSEVIASTKEKSELETAVPVVEEEIITTSDEITKPEDIGRLIAQKQKQKKQKEDAKKKEEEKKAQNAPIVKVSDYTEETIQQQESAKTRQLETKKMDLEKMRALEIDDMFDNIEQQALRRQ